MRHALLACALLIGCTDPAPQVESDPPGVPTPAASVVPTPVPTPVPTVVPQTPAAQTAWDSLAFGGVGGCDQYDGNALVTSALADQSVMMRVLIDEVMDAQTPIHEATYILPANGIVADLTWGFKVMQECSDVIDDDLVVEGTARLVEGTWWVSFDFTGEYVMADLILTDGVFEDVDTLERVDVEEWIAEDVFVSTNWGA